VPVFVWLGVALACLGALVRGQRTLRAATIGAIALTLVIHGVAFALNEARPLRARLDPHGADVEFVRHFVRDRYPDALRAPTVYAGAWGDSGYVWFDLGAQSYFSAVVVIFGRDTAVETRRRASVVRPFELERYARSGRLPEVFQRMANYLFAGDGTTRPATVSDLRRLCRVDEGVDVAVLAQRFDDLASAENGRVFVYECDRVRARVTG
jgi:hypothetical protein